MFSNIWNHKRNDPQPWTTSASLSAYSSVLGSCRTLAQEPKTWERAAKFTKSSKKVQKMFKILGKSSKNVQNKLSNDLRRLNNSPQPWTTCASLTPYSPVLFSCRTLAKEPRTWERAAKFKKSSKKVQKS